MEDLQYQLEEKRRSAAFKKAAASALQRESAREDHEAMELEARLEALRGPEDQNGLAEPLQETPETQATSAPVASTPAGQLGPSPSEVCVHYSCAAALQR